MGANTCWVSQYSKLECLWRIHSTVSCRGWMCRFIVFLFLVLCGPAASWFDNIPPLSLMGTSHTARKRHTYAEEASYRAREITGDFTFKADFSDFLMTLKQESVGLTPHAQLPCTKKKTMRKHWRSGWRTSLRDHRVGLWGGWHLLDIIQKNAPKKLFLKFMKGSLGSWHTANKDLFM